jgi:exonuclease VII large subunit
VDRLAARLRWSFGSRSKRAGDATSRLEARLLAASPRHGLRLARQRVDALSKHLEALSHRSVLKRGFSVTSDGRGRILRSIEGIRTGQTVQTELADGRFKSVVDGNTTERPSRRRARRKKASDDSQPWLFSQEKDETKDHADGENREDRA